MSAFVVCYEPPIDLFILQVVGTWTQKSCRSSLKLLNLLPETFLLELIGAISSAVFSAYLRRFHRTYGKCHWSKRHRKFMIHERRRNRIENIIQLESKALAIYETINSGFLLTRFFFTFHTVSILSHALPCSLGLFLLLLCSSAASRFSVTIGHSRSLKSGWTYYSFRDWLDSSCVDLLPKWVITEYLSIQGLGG